MSKKYTFPDQDDALSSVVNEPAGWVNYLQSHGSRMTVSQLNKRVIQLSRKGVPFSHARLVYESLGLGQKRMCDMIGITDRTFQRNIKENKMLNIIQSEKVLEAGILLYKGIEVFGNKEKFIRWLNIPNPTLDADPASLLDTNTGINLVVSELNRIEHSIY